MRLQEGTQHIEREDDAKSVLREIKVTSDKKGRIEGK